MNKLSIITVASVVTLSFSSIVFAGEKMHMKGEHHMMHVLMDTNGDGNVDKQEFQAFREQHFSGADANGDGNLTVEEFATMAKIMKEQRKKAKEMMKQKKMQKHFNKMDTNGDGKISKAEFDAKGERGFIRMDQNDDGVLNMEDRKAKMHDMKKMHKMKKKDD
ncbi:MAG: EF-hand domain-containing protein [Emcibacter sp.]|nr:EF-hand domain-containing protein [Emcibacter sp.]